MLQTPLNPLLLKTLNPIPRLELLPSLKRNSTLSILAHLLDVFLLVLEGRDDTYVQD